MTTNVNHRHETLEGLLGLLADTGYTPGRPPHVSKEAADADAQAAADTRCACCGRAGLLYLPFRKGASYVAVMTCPDDGAAWEF